MTHERLESRSAKFSTSFCGTENDVRKLKQPESSETNMERKLDTTFTYFYIYSSESFNIATCRKLKSCTWRQEEKLPDFPSFKREAVAIRSRPLIPTAFDIGVIIIYYNLQNVSFFKKISVYKKSGAHGKRSTETESTRSSFRSTPASVNNYELIKNVFLDQESWFLWGGPTTETSEPNQTTIFSAPILMVDKHLGKDPNTAWEKYKFRNVFNDKFHPKSP